MITHSEARSDGESSQNMASDHTHAHIPPCSILELLSSSAGNILDDEELINTLAQAKVGASA